MQGFELLYLAMFLLGFTGSAALVWWARRRMTENESEPVTIHEAQPPAPASRTLPSAGPHPTPLNLPSVSTEDVAEQPAIAQLIFARRGEGDQECPSCKRHFDETTIICPFDATPLRARVPRKTAKPAITGSRRPTCRSCGRRYESAANYCYHDGKRLSADSPAEVPVVRVCRSCGYETMRPYEQCNCDACDMAEVDPSRADITMPTVPMMQCRNCNHMSIGGDSHCPNDGHLLYPVMNVSMNALPPTGIGPRRKACETCGRKFATAVRYCAYDGSKLAHLN